MAQQEKHDAGCNGHDEKKKAGVKRHFLRASLIQSVAGVCTRATVLKRVPQRSRSIVSR
jgi:hypothetical protein